MKSTPRYIILANPASGNLPMRRRYALLKQAADLLSAEIHGLDTASAEEFSRCAREQAERCDVLVVAGGDGTFSLAINAAATPSTALAFLPFGTGNALTYALGYRGKTETIAARIRAGRVHACDLIDCCGKKRGFMVSLGIDGAQIRLYEKYRRRGYRGLNAHIRAGLRAYFKEYRPAGAVVTVDDVSRRVRRLTSFMVVKQPFFGMGLQAVPRARWGDGFLHTLTLASGLPGIVGGLFTGFTIGNRCGDYRRGKTAAVRSTTPLTLQIDGDTGWSADQFTFSVLAGAIRLKY
ncbi:diacylglycerol kinase family protein [uncultured Desulfosarcina sp.]|uniref:diacylglycerol/lipid kinase family protein n=1 Tax=uncultured Desulfosarcina sp. TaxID=218289 RepID=UPI0029C62427|nr:diacylglycerol kinase family protein [uncultured Desulfosarcina sp.]